MAIAVTEYVGSDAGAVSITIPSVVTTSGCKLVVIICGRDVTPGDRAHTVTFNGTSMGTAVVSDDSGSSVFSSVFVVDSPTATTADVVITFGGFVGFPAAAALVITGAATGTSATAGNHGSSPDPSNSISSTSGGLVLEAIAWNSSPITTTQNPTGRTDIYDSGSYERRGTRVTASGTSTTMGWTAAGTAWSQCLVSFDVAASGPTGTISASIPVTGSLTGAPVTAGAITGTVGVTGSLAGSPVATGALTSTVDVTGSLAGWPVPTGTITGTIDVTGTLTGSPIVAGTITNTIDVTGDLTGSPGEAGTITATVDVTGALDGSPIADGTLAASIDVTGSLSGSVGSEAIGTLAGTVDVTGDLAGTTAVTGAVTNTIDVTGDLTGSPVASGTLDSTITVSGSLSGEVGGSATGTITASVPITGELAGTSVVAGAVAATIGVTAALTGSPALVGELAASIAITASITGGPYDPDTAVTPASRTLVISAEVRALAIPHEDRTLRIEAT